jgi:DNA-directed RNA polymerase specialized sigma24 family protein
VDDRQPAALLAQWWPFILKLANQYRAWALADSADDLAGEIAERALRYFHSFDPAKGAFSTWVGHVAWTTAGRGRELALRRARRTADAADLLGLLADPREPNPADAAAESIDRAGLLERTRRAFFATLTPRERAALRRRFGLPGEAGPATSRQTLSRHVGRALERLRRQLAGAG